MLWKFYGRCTQASAIAWSPNRARSESTSTCSWETKTSDTRASLPPLYRTAPRFQSCPPSAADEQVAPMATTTVQQTTVLPAKHPVLRALTYLVGFLLALVLLLGGWGYWRVRQCLPQLDGEVHVKGLAAP